MLRSRFGPALSALGSFVLTVWAATSAEAAPIYEVAISGSGFAGVSAGPSGISQTISLVDNDPVVVRGGATAGPNGLGATASAVSAGDIGSVVSRATVTLDDIVITGPGSGNVVVGSLNLHLSGSLTLDEPTGATGGAAGAYIQTSGRLAGLIDLAGLINPCVSLPTQQSGCRGFPEYYSSGLLESASGYTFNRVFTTASAALPLNTPLSLLLTLEAGVGVSGPSTSAFSGFLDTLAFPTAGPVFNLPDGFTVNSVGGGIVDNRFGSGPAVPEPASLVLLGAALIAWRSRRSARRG